MPDEKSVQKPLYRQAAERLAGAGGDAEAFLARAAEPAGGFVFPGPECLHPDEIAEFQRTGKLPENRALHLSACDPCAAMCDASHPSPERVRAFRDMVAEIRPAGELWPEPLVSARKLSNAVVLIGLIAFGGATTYLMRPASVAVNRPVTVPPHPSSGSVVVVATTTPDPQGPIRVNTPPITVSANADTVATTVAASAAVVNHPVAFLPVDQTAEGTAAEFDPCRREMVMYYSDLLTEFSKDQEKDQSTDVHQWLAEYKKTSKKRVGALNFAFQGNGAQVVCTPSGGGMAVQGYTPINETLSAASMYLKTAAKKNLDPNTNENKMLHVSFGQASVSVHPAESKVDMQKIDVDHLREGMSVGKPNPAATGK